MEEKGNAFLSRYTIGLSYIRRIDSLNNKYYYLYDSHGDVTVITDANGNIVKSYDYDIYGKEQEEESDGQVFYNPIRYSGQFFDEESGLYYLRARYYSPEIMRFVSEDTYKGDINNPLTLNLYAYCGGNPVMYDDPSGHFFGTIIGGLTGGLIGGISSAIQGKDVWTGVLSGAASGAIAGAAVDIAAATVGTGGLAVVIVAGGGAVGSAVGDVIDQVGNKWKWGTDQEFMEACRNIDLISIGESFLIGGIFGAISGGTGVLLDKALKRGQGVFKGVVKKALLTQNRTIIKNSMDGIRKSAIRMTNINSAYDATFTLTYNSLSNICDNYVKAFLENIRYENNNKNLDEDYKINFEYYSN